MKAQILDFPSLHWDIGCEVEKHEAKIYKFKKRGSMMYLRFNGLWFEWVWEI